jgi:ribose 5-phosphate isomerase A
VGSWKSVSDAGLEWDRPIDNIASKRQVAQMMAQRLRPGDIVGVGSGSTSFLTVQALAARAAEERIEWTAVPTSDEVALACAALGVRTTSLAALRPDWAFDGADEVDDDKRLIKGRGGALLREKLVMASTDERYIVVDQTKLVQRLGTNFAVPIEVVPEALALVQAMLSDWGEITDLRQRAAGGKDGGVVTERGNLLVDARFDTIGDDVESRLSAIPGVVESGVFIGYDPNVVVAK